VQTATGRLQPSTAALVVQSIARNAACFATSPRVNALKHPGAKILTELSQTITGHARAAQLTV
jgi:hypothetical protein